MQSQNFGEDFLARLRTLAPFQINAARMTATVALSAAIDNRRHLIGSTRTTLSVSRSRLRRGRAFRVADCSSLRATKSRLIEPCEYARSIGASPDPTPSFHRLCSLHSQTAFGRNPR